MMGKRFLLTMALAMPLWVCGTRAQERVITIEELFGLCSSNSNSIGMARAALQQSEQGVEIAKSAKLPSLEASLSASFLGDGYVIDRNFGNATKADMPHFGNNFALKASQVIYAGGAIDAGIRQAKIQRDIAAEAVELTEQNIRFAMLGKYLELYKLRNLATVYNRNIGQTTMLLEQIKALHEEGVLVGNDVTRYELRLEQMRLALSEIESNIGIINYSITTALDLPKETIIMPDSSLIEKEIESYDLEFWQQEAARENSNIHIADLGLQMQKQKERSALAERLPQIALVAENHFDGPITIEVPVIDKNFNYWFVGVGIRYDISSLWKSNHKSRAERIGTLRAEQNSDEVRRKTDIEVNSAYTDLLQSFTNLRTQEKSLELANGNYDIVNNRYLNGLALVTEMIDADNARIDAELQLVNARINVVFSHYNLKRATGNL